MNQERLLTPVNTLWVGAIDGLLIGLTLEAVRVTYLNYQMGLAAREYVETNLWADFTRASWEPLTPLACGFVLAVVSFLVRKYFIKRPRVLLFIWFALGGIALALGYFMSTLSPDLFSFLWLFGLVAVIYFVHRFWLTYRESLPLVWAINGISAVIVVAVGIQLVGLFFYWPELRRPLIWLVCLVGVVAISVVFGAVIQIISNLWKRKEAGVQ